MIDDTEDPADDGTDEPDEADRNDEPAEVTCPECGRRVYEEAERCPYCGSYISLDDAPGNKPWWWITAVVVVILLLLAYLLKWV